MSDWFFFSPSLNLSDVLAIEELDKEGQKVLLPSSVLISNSFNFQLMQKMSKNS